MYISSFTQVKTSISCTLLGLLVSTTVPSSPLSGFSRSSHCQILHAQPSAAPPPPLGHLATDIPILAPLLFTPPRCCVRLDSFSGGKSNPVALSCSLLPVPCSTCLWRLPEISCFFYTFLYCLNT